MRTVSLDQVGGEELALPPGVQEALGELVGSAKEGLLALSVGVGLAVLVELLEEEVVEIVGAKGKHDADRVAVRHGHEAGEVTLGGRRVAVERPRVRSADGRCEVRLATYEYFAARDPLARSVLERMLAGVSTRRYRRTQEPVGADVEQQARSTSKSSVSRTFIARTRVAMSELMSRRLDDLRLAVMMVDGIDLGERAELALFADASAVSDPVVAVDSEARPNGSPDGELEACASVTSAVGALSHADGDRAVLSALDEILVAARMAGDGRAPLEVIRSSLANVAGGGGGAESATHALTRDEVI